ncbi:9335_t:CDS:2, partial [Dentiscutata heterogama]
TKIKQSNNLHNKIYPMTAQDSKTLRFAILNTSIQHQFQIPFFLNFSAEVFQFTNSNVDACHGIGVITDFGSGFNFRS